MQEIVADTMARWTASGFSGWQVIARRSGLPRRSASVEDVRVELGHEKKPNHVREMRKEEVNLKEGDRRHGDASVHRRWRTRRRRVAGLVGGVRAAWWRVARVLGAKVRGEAGA